MPIATTKTLAQRQAEIDKAKHERKKTKSKPPREKSLVELMASVRNVVIGYKDKTDIQIFDMAGYGNGKDDEEATAAYCKAVESPNADDGLVRAYLTGLLKQEALSMIKASAAATAVTITTPA